ncbi:NAD(P)-dependent oxidoreductase [Pseudomonas putida]|uniref:NAD(P)-dependent oxidoreductase n=1 Tax=Pseudomonas putida TaxID=303 RepID=UPI00068E7F06|nr:NAD(P)-dependent oxidoreductase [Pseudomonas putida]
MKILMIDSLQVNYVEHGEFDGLRDDGCEVKVTCTPTPGQLAWADGIVAFHSVKVDSVLLAQASRCRALVKATTGVDDVDMTALRAKGIRFANIGQVGVEEVAEHSLALVLLAQRRLLDYFQHTLLGGWCWRECGTQAPGGLLKPCNETVLGVLGYGAIGQAVARRAAVFGYQLKFHDPAFVHCPDGVAQACSFEALLAQADILTLHLPLTSATHHLFNERNLARLKPGAVLVNTSRGGLIDSDSLLRALDSGQVSQALLDVVEHEPAILPALRAHARVALTPHAAFCSQRSLSTLKARALGTLLAMLEKTPSVTANKRWPQDQEGDAHV